ncbi:MAG: Hemolysin-type calcium-binding protein [Myxococcaceae bacterium]|nr:Hemolysin-type calcium-binding protein [Myxococcaceae bacterium]
MVRLAAGAMLLAACAHQEEPPREPADATPIDAPAADEGVDAVASERPSDRPPTADEALPLDVVDVPRLLDAPPVSDVPDVVSPPDVPAAPTNLPRRSVGIWYSTWYAQLGHYLWIRGHGVGSDRQLLADVNGDGRADAVVYVAGTGSWYAALSHGDGFGGYSLWIRGHGIGSNRQYLADVNGDGRADAVAYFANSGTWYVGPSTGTAFAPYGTWIAGHGIGSTTQLLGDVNGDGRADAIAYFANTGTWYVAPSTGGSFAPYGTWIAGHGIGSTRQFLGDVNGDGRADAVVFFADGRWYMAPSTGGSFAPYGPPAAGHGVGSTEQLLADVDGDHRADAVVFYASTGQWYAARSNGGSFAVPAPGATWVVEHGAVGPNGHGARADAALLGDVYGRGVASPVIFTAAEGAWRALPAERVFKPNMLNTWEAWNLRYLPRTLGAYRTYDSGEAAVIDEHLGMLGRAGVDFLLLDETNSLDVDGGYIKARALAVCARIAARRAADPATPRYALGVGAIQYTHDPASLEAEAGAVWAEFVQGAACGGAANHAYLNGKPLLVVYAELGDRRRWEAWAGDKSRSARFTVRWMQGILGTAGAGQCQFPGGANPGGPIPTADRGLYFGWGVLNGTLSNATTMVVMPGWNNHRGCRVGRDGGAFYRAQGWDPTLRSDPEVAVINSFNEYAEETAVAPTDTSAVAAPTEAWSDPDLYWNLTVSYCARRGR